MYENGFVPYVLRIQFYDSIDLYFYDIWIGWRWDIIKRHHKSVKIFRTCLKIKVLRYRNKIMKETLFSQHTRPGNVDSGPKGPDGGSQITSQANADLAAASTAEKGTGKGKGKHSKKRKSETRKAR